MSLSIVGIACREIVPLMRMSKPYSSPSTEANANRMIRPRKSRAPWITFAVFAAFHTVAMLPVGVQAYGVPFGTLIQWLLFDFPISWVIVLGFDAPSDRALKIALLIGGGLQWGVWGWLFATFVKWINKILKNFDTRDITNG